MTDEVLEAMLPFLRGQYMNPSSGYAEATAVRNAVEEARSRVAALVGASAGEITFTSGATESINTVIAGMRKMSPGKPILCLPTDHPATLHALTGSNREGAVLYGDVDSQGLADPGSWEKNCAAGIAGATFTWANNETGVIQNADHLVNAAHQHNIPVHIDAVQCLGKMPVNIHETGVEYASFSAHKLHGPKGIGALYIRAGVVLPPFILGGDQEDGKRGGTENVPGIIGFGAAAAIAQRDLDEASLRMAKLRDAFETGLMSELDGLTILSCDVARIPNTSNIYFDGCTAQSLSLLLEPWGVLCSAGSACKTSNPNPSHVLLAMGLSDEQTRRCLRFSMSSLTTAEEVEQGIKLVVDAVRRVRSVQSSRTGPVTVYTP